MENLTEKEIKKTSTWDIIADVLIVVYILLMFFNLILNFLGPKIFDDWYYGTTKYVQGFFWILSNMSLILVGVAIKNIYIKIFGILMALIIALYNSYSNLEWMLQDNSPF
jgi:hypothetical protein